jgi:hypothetical protein
VVGWLVEGSQEIIPIPTTPSWLLILVGELFVSALLVAGVEVEVGVGETWSVEVEVLVVLVAGIALALQEVLAFAVAD